MSTICLHCGKPMQSQRSTKKYCSDNCKQLAFYKRSGSALSGIKDNDSSFLTDRQHTEKELFNDKETIQEPISKRGFKEQATENLALKSLSDKQPVIVNDSFNVKQEEKEPPYQWVSSRMVDAIADYLDNSEEKSLDMFQHPENYWGAYTLPHVKWVSLRLRCLLEAMIRLSLPPRIDYSILITVKQAFDAIVKSRHFSYLSSNYPYTALIKELQLKFEELEKQHKDNKSIQFRLTHTRKIELIAKRYILAGFVPALKFSEMDFNE